MSFDCFSMDNPDDLKQLVTKAQIQFMTANRATYGKKGINKEDKKKCYQAELSCFTVIQRMNDTDKISIEMVAPSIKLYKQVVDKKDKLELDFCRDHEECTRLYFKMLNLFGQKDFDDTTSFQRLLDIIVILIAKKEKNEQLKLMKQLGEQCTSKAKRLLELQPEQLKKIRALLDICNCIKSQKVVIDKKQLHHLTPERQELFQQLRALESVNNNKKRKKKKEKSKLAEETFNASQDVKSKRKKQQMIDFQKITRGCDVLMLRVEGQLSKKKIDKKTKETIFLNLDKLIIRAEDSFLYADKTKVTKKKIEYFDKAEKQYQTLDNLFNCLYEKTKDKRAQKKIQAIQTMLTKISWQQMGTIIVDDMV